MGALRYMLASLVLLLASAFAAPVHGQARVAIPDASALYRHRVEQVAADVWGVDASPARLAAQLHQESAWRPRAQSPGVGAQGLAQFMPATARLAMPLASPSFAGRSNRITGTSALAQWAAICAPITPAPSTATLRMMRRLMRFSG